MARRNDVTVNVGGDSRGAQAALDSTAKNLKRFSDETKKLVGGLGGQIFSLRGALVGLASAVSVRQVVSATVEQDRAMRQLDATLRSTGRGAQITRERVLEMAGALQQVTTFGDEAIVPIADLLLQMDQLGVDVLPRATEAVLDLSTKTGQGLAEAAKKVGKALNDPVRAIGELREVGIQFSADQEALIRNFQETNRIGEAQRVVLAKLETQFGGSARAARDTLGGALQAAKNALGDLLEGDQGNINDAKAAIEELTKTLNDPAIKQGFANLAGGIAQLLKVAAEVPSELNDLSGDIRRFFRRIRGETKVIELLREEIEDVDKALRGSFLTRPIKFIGKSDDDLQRLRGELEERIRAIEALDRLVEGRSDSNSSALAPIDAGPTPPPVPTGTPLTKAEIEARLKAAAAASAAILQAELARAEAELEDSLKRRLITVEQYYQAKQDLELGAIDAEIEALQAARERANAVEQIQIDGQIEALRIKRVAAAQQLARDETEAYGEERLRQLERVQQDVAAVLESFDRAQAGATAGLQVGALTSDAAQTMLREQAAAALRALQALRTELQAMAAQDVPGAAEALNSLGSSMGNIAQQTQGPVATALQTLRSEWSNLQQNFAASSALAARDAVSGLLTDLATGSKSAGDALKDFARNFAISMAQIASQALATYAVLTLLDAIYPGLGKATAQTLSVGGGVLHEGGFAGENGSRRVIPALTFAGAPRLHEGGVLGLRPGEVPAILERGEEVLAKNDPRNARNSGGEGGTRVINVIDPNLVQDYMTSSSGERVILNLIERNSGSIKQLIR